MVRTNRLRPSMGLFGGYAGAPAINEYTSAGVTRAMPAAGYTHLECRAGDVLYHQIAGCGGFGDPFERSSADVLRDVQEGRVSVAVAESQYGVAIVQRDDELVVDRERTGSLRRSRRAA